ncbi:MAG TPA: twin-arginine translocase subunit TatC [Candidatus Acidoferrales bacterium]|jgi:sec-independent protein translocase protein TatC|nr:twin-arginine translocase subunit TatC [Candidatus Acidoferrales bacterium]
MAPDYETEPSDEAEGGPVKSFLEHLEDFRWVLIKSLVCLGVAMLICLMGANHVVGILKWPMTHNLLQSLAQTYKWTVPWATRRHEESGQVAIVSFGTNQIGSFQISPDERAAFGLGTNQFVSVDIQPLMVGTNLVLGWHAGPDKNAVADAKGLNIDLINLSPAGAFFVAFQVAFYGGMVLSCPFILYFIASFVFPALRMHERKHVYRALFFGCGLFITGVSFCYFVLMPVALAASQMYSNWLGFGALQWRAEDYISFVCRFMVGMGLGFELPVVVLTLVKIGVLSYSTLAGARRYMIVINLILGAVLTTPEVITQLVMFVPLQLLYEITVWIAWYWDRQEKKREALNR